MMTDWNIQSRAHACQACEKTFVDKQAYHTILFDERADLSRMDVCVECWEREYREGARERKGFVSYWNGIYNAPPSRQETVQKETAETLLRKVIELDDPKNIPAAFILAVMLERKRALKVKEQFVRDGRRIFIYEQPGTGDVFTVADPELQLNQLEAVQRDVAALLEHGLQPPPSTPEAAAPAAAEPTPPEAPAPAAD